MSTPGQGIKADSADGSLPVTSTPPTSGASRSSRVTRCTAPPLPSLGSRGSCTIICRRDRYWGGPADSRTVTLRFEPEGLT
jgi:hypothetical protein